MFYIFVISFTLLIQIMVEVTCSKDLPCRYDRSIDISSGFRTIDGNIIHNSIEYSKNQYGIIKSEIRGCICDLPASKPCILFCCQPGYTSQFHPNQECENSTHEVHLNTSNNRHFEEFKAKDRYTVMLGYSLEIAEHYFLVDYVDEWMLLKNGSLHFEDQIYDFGEYCFERILKDDLTVEVSVAIFLKDGMINIEEDENSEISFYYHNYVVYMSICFLVLTLIIYAWIPELQNLRGKVMMCYMTLLTVFYIIISYLKLDNLPISKMCTIIGYMAYTSAVFSILFLNVINMNNFFTQFFKNWSRKWMKRIFCWYILFVIIVSLMILSFAVLSDISNIVPEKFKPRIGVLHCFLHFDRLSSFIHFYSIIIILFGVNFLLTFFVFLHKICNIRNPNLQTESFLHLLLFYLVVDCAWIMDAVIWGYQEKIPESTLKAMNFSGNSQGIWIFIVCVLRSKVFLLIKKRFSTLSNHNTNIVESVHYSSNIS